MVQSNETLAYAVSPDRPPAAMKWVSESVCFICVATCLGAAIWVPVDRQYITKLYQDFHLKLPAVTQWAIDLPTGLIWAAGGLAAAASVLAQVFLRSKRNAIVVHLAIFAICCLLIALYRDALLRAFYNLMMSMTAGVGGKG